MPICFAICVKDAALFTFFFFQAEDGIRDVAVTGVQTCALPISAREAQWADFPSWTQADLREAYAGKGIRQLYSHQAAAAEAVLAGKNVVVVTPTASGKTLCYNLPILNAILESSDSRALYLFPPKALAQDQLAELH